MKTWGGAIGKPATAALVLMTTTFHMLTVVALLAATSGCSSSEPSGAPGNSARAQWLAENATLIRSLQPDGSDFADLEPLRALFDGVRVVMLGESHEFGAAFLAKTRLVQFLHQELGFDVLAFETGLFDGHKAWELIVRGEPTASVFRSALPIVWGESQQVQPLADYVDSMAAGAHPLQIAGIDSSSWELAALHLFTDLETFLKSIEAPSVRSPDWRDRRNLLEGLHAGGTQDIDDRGRLLEKLRSEIEEVSSRSDEASFWIQVLTTMMASNGARRLPPEDRAARVAVRDQRMASNLLWLANERFADRKIIVWAANTHIMRNREEMSLTPEATGILSEADALGSEAQIDPWLREWGTMADFVWPELGNEMYALGFVAYQGTRGTVLQTPRPLPPAEPNSLEGLLDQAGIPIALLDLREPRPGGDWLRSPNLLRFMRAAPARADWTRVFDGILFIRDMTPSTPVSG